MTDALLRSPLYDRHSALGAKFASFGGWEMPLEYPGGGVLKEHNAVRQAVGVFDVSHLGKVTVSGTGAAAFINRCFTNDVGRIASGQAQYTLCCDDATGGVVDDLIAYVYADDHVFLIPNAANTAEVAHRLTSAAPEGITVTNQHADYAILAVQGPRSAELLKTLGLPTDHEYMSFEMATLKDTALTVCRTGYTGEHGYELVVPSGQASVVWDALMSTQMNVQPAGLAARDTLRLEMGYPLHGQDLSLEISPVQARIGWAVGWKKEEFWGRQALLAEKAAGPRRGLWGLLATDRGIPRALMTVLRAGSDEVVGEVTSGTFSPTKKLGIALALINADAGLVEGDDVELDVRGRRSVARIVKPPFVDPSVK